MPLIQIKHLITGAVLFEADHESLKELVEAAVGARANLYGAKLCGANLYGANLYGANLDGANLYGANLYGANLDGANLDDESRLPTGETFAQYKSVVVPALLSAGGKTIEEVLSTGCWDCHEWTNCPMAVAFGVNDLANIPLLFKPRAEQFVKLFDAKLIPRPQSLLSVKQPASRMVADESIEDTIADLVAYCLLYLARPKQGDKDRPSPTEAA